MPYIKGVLHGGYKNIRSAMSDVDWLNRVPGYEAKVVRKLVGATRRR